MFRRRIVACLMIVAGVALALGSHRLVELADAVSGRAQTRDVERWTRLNSRAAASERPQTTSVRGTIIKPGNEGYLLLIPRLGLRLVVRELEPEVFSGRNTPRLRRYGLGQVPYTPQLGNVSPGGNGTAAITGHRTTSGAPFRHIDRLRAGDIIIIRSKDVEQQWTVVGAAVVPPSAIGAIKSRRGTKRLVLLACTPPFTARERLLVNARLKHEVATSSRLARGQDTTMIASKDNTLRGSRNNAKFASKPTQGLHRLDGPIAVYPYRRGAGAPARAAQGSP